MATSGQTIETIDILRDRIIELQRSEDENKRILIALTGIPGSGKSTIAAKLLEGLCQAGMEDVAVIPMDGYHYSKTQLSAFPDAQEALLRRGAPFTYDAPAFTAAARHLRDSAVTKNHQSSRKILLPSFDHAIHHPVESGIIVKSNTKVVILEGNYVLLNQPPWNQIAEIVQDRWFVNAPRGVARDRLIKRHLQVGIETTVAAAEERVEGNDLRNGDLILASLIQPNVILHNKEVLTHFVYRCIRWTVKTAKRTLESNRGFNP